MAMEPTTLHHDYHFFPTHFNDKPRSATSWWSRMDSLSITQRWLRDVTQGPYAHHDRVFADADTILRAFPSLRPKTDSYTYDDGRTQLLLCLFGTLPISYRSVTYNIPVAFWLPRDYPASPPMAYVVPTSDMLVRAGEHVELSGRCRVDYLDVWSRKSEACNLLDLVRILQDVFSRQPPLYAKPKQLSNVSPPAVCLPSTTSAGPPTPIDPRERPPPPTPAGPPLPSASSGPPTPIDPRERPPPPTPAGPPPPTTSATSPTLIDPRERPPPPTRLPPRPPPPPEQPQSPIQPSFPSFMVANPPHTHLHQPSTMSIPADHAQSNYSQSLVTSPQSSTAPAAPAAAPQVPPPPRPPNPELLSLHARLHAKLSTRIAQLTNSLSAQNVQLEALRSDLERGELAIRDEIARLEAVRSVCESVGNRMEEVVGLARARVEEVASKPGPEPDELICSTTIVYNQLIDLVAEDNAIEDTMYHLGRALNSERIDLDRFLKQIRFLAREQFMKRALTYKILDGLGWPATT